MTAYQNDLDNLRWAAEARNPEQRQFILKKLMMQMGFYIAIAVVIERVFPFVEIFEENYPDAIWARQALVQMASLGTVASDLPQDAMAAYLSPGAGNFMKALSDLAHGLHSNTQKETKLGYLVSATEHGIMAELADHYYHNRLEDWERVRQNQFDPTTGQYSDPETAKIAYTFWMDEDIALLDVDSWLLVADSVEEKLKRG